MKKFLYSLVTLGLFSTHAFADECDYVGRHYKTNLSPVSVTAYAASRQGDITFGPSLSVQIKNTGVNTITDPSGPGSIVHARRIALSVKGHTLYGWLAAPMAPGQTVTASFDIPEGLIDVCERVTATIDADRQIGQWGCAVHGDDAITFRARFGSRYCIADHIREFPGGGIIGQSEEESEEEFE